MSQKPKKTIFDHMGWFFEKFWTIDFQLIFHLKYAIFAWNPAFEAWKNGILWFFTFQNYAIQQLSIGRRSGQYQGSKGVVWGFLPPEGFRL